jgi:hypothetical protein
VANRLASESSPYLLLHAENPVDWYPWGDEVGDSNFLFGAPAARPAASSGGGQAERATGGWGVA